MLPGISAHGRNQKFFYYGHKFKKTTFHQDKKCSVKNVRADKLEGTVLDRLTFISKDKELLMKLGREASRKLSQTLPQLERKIAELEQERRKIQSQIDNIVDHLSNLPKDMANRSLYERLSELEKKVAHLETEKEELKTQKQTKAQTDIDTQSLFQFLQILNTELPHMPAQRKRDILRLVIKSIIVLSPYRVRLNYFYGGEVEATMDLEKQSNREEIRKDLDCIAGSYVFQSVQPET